MLQELTNADEDLLQILTSKHSMTATVVSLPQQVGSLQYHKKALGSSVIGSLLSAEVEEEAARLQEHIQGKLSACGEESPDATQLKHTWQTIQVSNHLLAGH